MTSEYSIELQAENIINHKTREYFNEVLSSYINGNYRSAIVVLWTVSVCDLFYKLQELNTIYNDESAKNILKEIKSKQNNKPTSAEWEAELIKLLKERTHMFNSYEIIHLEALHKQRHLSAHPILKEDLNLYQPNKETTRAMIRNTLEYVLTKPAMATNKIFKELINDLAEKRDLFTEINDLDKYLTAKYYMHLPLQVKEYTFKQLWKFVFKLKNDDADKNRNINLKALAVLYKQNMADFDEYLQEENTFFSNNISLEEDIDIKYFVVLCSKYPKIYALIDETYKPPIVERIKQNKVIWAKAFFINNSPDDYVKALKNEIGIDIVVKNKKLGKTIIDYAKDNDVLNKFIKIFIERYGESTSFDDADNAFDALIEPILPYLNKEQFIMLLRKIEANNQIYNRGKALIDHKKVKEYCDQICGEIEYNEFPRFLRSIEEEEE